MAKKLFVRFATAADERAIVDFYNQNKHPFVFQRDLAVWKERIASGAVTLIEDENGKIVASSISYPIVTKEGAHEWTEIGSTRVALSGIGLAKPLISAQILRAFFLEPPNDRFVMEIVKGNAHSKHVFTKMGCAPFNIPKALLEKVQASIAPGSGQAPVEWFQMGAEAMPHLARSFLDAQSNPVLKNPKTGEEYELDLSRCVLAQRFLQEIKKLAASNFGLVSAPDPSCRIQTAKKCI